MSLPGLPRPLECLLRGLLEENHLSSWTSDWADGDVTLTIRFSSKEKTQGKETTHGPVDSVETTQQGASGISQPEKMKVGEQLFSSESEDEQRITTKAPKKKAWRATSEEGSASNPRRYHLLELDNSPDFPEKLGSFPDSTKCAPAGMMVVEEKGAGLRGITPSVSSSSEEAGPPEKEMGQKDMCYRTINLRDFGNTYSSSSAENSSPEGLDEVDAPMKSYNQTNASDTADKFDATRLIDIPE